MQTIKLAFVEVLEYQHSIELALRDKKVIIFEIVVANCTTPSPIAAIPNRSGLVDGSVWQLKSGRRYKQQITTFPDLLLSGAKINGFFSTYKELLERWAFAEGRWIQSGEARGLFNTDRGTEGYVKVITADDGITFEPLEQKNWAIMAAFEVETMDVV
jgi:hypothetical protein